MFDSTSFWLFLLAASAIAIVPGPGILYVAARTLAGGRAEGVASSLGTGIGGLVHVVAGALGISAIVMASAQAFTVLKIAGAVYLIWLGVRTYLQAGGVEARPDIAVTGSARAFRDGILVEALNPKTALFFLAFIPQFVDPSRGSVASQFIALGLVSVALNTLVDLVVAMLADKARRGVAASPTLVKRMQQGCGALLCGLGVSLGLARQSA
jgi:threonine/homoserine/homoserine lactone efflux protein